LKLDAATREEIVQNHPPKKRKKKKPLQAPTLRRRGVLGNSRILYQRGGKEDLFDTPGRKGKGVYNSDAGKWG